MKTLAKSKQARLLGAARGVKQAVLGVLMQFRISTGLGISPEGWQIVAGG